MDWPMRSKMAVLLVVASALPLIIAALIDRREGQQRLLANTAALLAARGDQLRGEIDEFHRAYQRSVDRVARFPTIVALAARSPANENRPLASAARAILDVYPASDTQIRGAALLDLAGNVRAATDSALVGKNLAFHRFVRDALRGTAVISDVYVDALAPGADPTIAYLAPVIDSNRTLVGVSALWVHASALWSTMRAANGLAGPGSFAVLFDHDGIRIAHTYSQEIVFHSAGQLAPATMSDLVGEARFGPQTKALLEDIRSFPLQFERSLSATPDTAMFHGLAPVNRRWNYGVGRRLEAVPWTLFYMIPDGSLNAQITALTWHKLRFAAGIVLIALIAGAAFAVVILKPVQALSTATDALGRGDLTARVAAPAGDELGRVGGSFNAMAARIEAQASALQFERDELERRVNERTATLAKTADDLRGSEERTRLIVETALDAVITIGADGVISGWSAQAETTFGWAHHDAVGRLLETTIVPERYRDAHRQGLGRYLATGKAVVLNRRLELTGLHRDGHEFPIELSITPIKTGDAVSFSAFVRDITDRKNAEEKVQAQLGRLNLLQQITRAVGERQDLRSVFQVVINTLEDRLAVDFACIFLYDDTLRTLSVASVGSASAPAAGAIGLIDGAQVATDQNGLARCVRAELVYEPDIGDLPFPFPQQLAGAGLRALVASPLLVDKRVFGVLVVARRASESFTSGECEFLLQLSEHVALAARQAELHDALRLAYDDLRLTQNTVVQQERLSALGQMASGIAHDINNAISPVALYTESLLETEPALSDRGRGYLQTIARAIDDVAATVARMREFYRQREPQLTLAPVPLNRAARDVIALTRARWNDMPQRRGVMIEMRTDLDANLPAIMGVENEIREALTNLIFNAVDSMPEGGEITVRTHAARPTSGVSGAPQSVHIDVVDTGIGMDEATRRKCLEPFFTTKGERGTGLGLAMVYGVVQRHSAEMEIHSAVGTGTTVRLSFSPAPNINAGLIDQPPPDIAATPLRVLVIDDDPLLLKSLRDTLQFKGHSIVTANGGQLGIDAFKEALERGEPFPVVITDLGMPYVDGRKVAAAIKALAPSTHVILLTGWGHRLIAEGEMPAHIDTVVSKPPKMHDLAAALAQGARNMKQ